jgi:hypothetical protein
MFKVFKDNTLSTLIQHSTSAKATPPWCLRQNYPASSRSSDIQRRRNLPSHSPNLRLELGALCGRYPWSTRKINLSAYFNPIIPPTRLPNPSINTYLAAVRYPHRYHDPQTTVWLLEKLENGQAGPDILIKWRTGMFHPAQG